MKKFMGCKWSQIEVFSLIVLIMITILSSEPYGTSLKYGVVPLFVAVIASLSDNKWTITVSVFHITALFFVFWIMLSTVTSDIVDWSPSARSTCLLVLSTIILTAKRISINNLRIIIDWYCKVVLLCSVIALYRIFSIGVTSFSRYNLLFITNKKDVNYLSAFLVPGIVFFVYKIKTCFDKKRYIYIGCCIPPILYILLVESRANFITILFCVFFFFLIYVREKKLDIRKLVVILGMFGGAICFYLWITGQPLFERLTSIESYKDNIRIKIWSEALKALKSHPIMGSGLGASSMYSYKVWRYQSHNNFLDILGDHGIIGMVLFCIMLGNVFWKTRKFFLHMLITVISFLLPLAFINGFQTFNFWIPMIIIYYISEAYRNGSNIEDIYCT